MNYYDARQLSDGGGWHYTSLNRREGTHAVGYCSRFHPCRECGDQGQPECPFCAGRGYVDLGEQHYKTHVHATAEEACECFRRYLLDGQHEEVYSDWTGCEWEGCDTPTKRGLATRPPLGHGFALCNEHRTSENLEVLTAPIGQIVASY